MNNKKLIERCLRGLEETLSTSYNRVWDAYNFHKSWWTDRENVNNDFVKCWDAGIEQILNCISNIHKAIEIYANVRWLNQIGEELYKLAPIYRVAASEFYSCEDCWNPKLPLSITKVHGHKYSCTEFIRQRTYMVAEDLEYYGRVLKELRSNEKK